ncbi:hypothetical protein Taro_007066, partial [Colocasia esculenta]|nr:hypothetical protein [Colocasia esculenta]
SERLNEEEWAAAYPDLSADCRKLKLSPAVFLIKGYDNLRESSYDKWIQRYIIYYQAKDAAYSQGLHWNTYGAINTHLLGSPKHPTKDKSQEYSARREEERERGICIQRSRAAPPRGEEGEEEGEEEEELEIAGVLVQKEIQSKLGSIVVQRFEYFVLCFGAPVLWVGAVVLWCLSRGAQGLVNLLNSQVVFGVGRCAYLLGFFELLNSKRLESSCSSVYRFCHGSVDTPTTGVDTGFQTLRQNDEEKVKCVDTASSGVDTRPSSQRTQLTGLYSVSTQPQVVSTLDLTYGAINTHLLGSPNDPTKDKSQEYSARREEEREGGICIQRSRAAPPRGEEGEEEEGEEEEELEIAGVLVQKEIQPSLYLIDRARGSIL